MTANDRLSDEDISFLWLPPSDHETKKVLMDELIRLRLENERLTGIEDRLITFGCHNPDMRHKVTEILGHPYKDSVQCEAHDCRYKYGMYCPNEIHTKTSGDK